MVLYNGDSLHTLSGVSWKRCQGNQSERLTRVSIPSVLYSKAAHAGNIFVCLADSDIPTYTHTHTWKGKVVDSSIFRCFFYFLSYPCRDPTFLNSLSQMWIFGLDRGFSRKETNLWTLSTPPQKESYNSCWLGKLLVACLMRHRNQSSVIWYSITAYR